MKTLLTTLILLSAVSASGQSVNDTRPSLTVPTIVYATASAGDWASTSYFTRRGWSESNPTLGWLSGHPVALPAAGMAEDAATIYVAHRLLARRHPKLLTVGLYAMSAFRVSLIVHNLHNTPDLRRPH